MSANVCGSGLWFPTPTATNYGRNKSLGPNAQERMSLQTMARRNMWPTPTVHGNYNRKGASKTSGDGLATAVKLASPPEDGGPLNPTWVEWLMGWPMGWTDLKPLAMDRYQQWQQQHGAYLATLTDEGIEE